MNHPIQVRLGQEYCIDQPVDLYASPAGNGLVTQAASGRHLTFLQEHASEAEGKQGYRVRLCEDDYPGWLAAVDLSQLSIALQPYHPSSVSAEAIQRQIPAAIAFAQAAMAQPNSYRWGGTLGPNYDCSGLVQAAFSAVGVMLPRDSYQQEAFVDAVEPANLKRGDLIFFGSSDRTTHVALYIGSGNYIHSSGKDQGRNGIGIDSLWTLDHPVSRTYYQQIRGYGRVTRSYQATGHPIQCR